MFDFNGWLAENNWFTVTLAAAIVVLTTVLALQRQPLTQARSESEQMQEASQARTSMMQNLTTRSSPDPSEESDDDVFERPTGQR